ncbi:MAG: hypothetical protein K2N56_04580 [Oscillospiraceae bacterium]|nr:hypothetical protein [Oscillospiraceae bacterium]
MKIGSNKIYADFLKANRFALIRCWLIGAGELALVWFARSSDYLKWGLLIIAVWILGLAVMATLDVAVFSKRKLEASLFSMSEEERAALFEQYEKAHSFGGKKFLDEYLIFFLETKIFFLKYTDILSAELKGYKLLLDIGEKRPVKMPFDAEENPALLVAAMRSRNPKISVILNGKVVEKMENK